MEIIHKKGEHSSSPILYKPWVRRLSGSIYFTEESKYNLGSVDQYDWNKVTGISFNPLKPNENAIMIAWRYNPSSDYFEVGPYFNIAGTNLAPDTKFIKVRIGESVGFYLDYDYAQVTGKIDVKTSTYFGKHPFLTSFRIQPWFGGNMATPSLIKYHLNFN